MCALTCLNLIGFCETSVYNVIINSLFLMSTNLEPCFFFHPLNLHIFAHLVMELITYSLSVYIIISRGKFGFVSSIISIALIHAFTSAILFVIGCSINLIDLLLG